MEKIIKGKITKRDLKVVDFLGQYKIATTTTLKHFIFNDNKIVAQRRLKLLNDKNIVKRTQDYIGEDYYYYLKKPKQLKHSLLITDFFREFSKIYKIEHFDIQKKIDNIIPDAMIGYYNKSGKQRVAFLEVEISNKGFDYNKYHLTCSKIKYTSGFNPIIFVVTKQNIKEKDNLHFVKLWDIEKDFKKLELCDF